MLFEKSDEAKRQQIEKLYAQSKQSFPEVPDTSAEDLLERCTEGDVVLVDVRTDEEQAVSMIKGAIRATEFEANAEQYKDKTIACYCTIGHRSGLYTQKLVDRGFNAVNLRGAILAWTHAGGELEHDGTETKKVNVFSNKYAIIAEGYEPVW